MAELADALVLGSSVYDVQVQVLLSALNNKSFNNNSIIEMLVDGDIEVVEILKSKNYVQTKV